MADTRAAWEKFNGVANILPLRNAGGAGGVRAVQPRSGGLPSETQAVPSSGETLKRLAG